MAKISLLKKIEAAKTIGLKFVGFTTTKTRENTDGVSETIIHLELETPIERVVGSQTVDLDGQGNVRLSASNVMEVSVSESDVIACGEDAFQWDEEESIGTFNSKDLVLDVAKRNAAVWLKTVPFNVQASNYRASQLQGRLKDAFGGANAIMSKVGGNTGSANRTNIPAGGSAPNTTKVLEPVDDEAKMGG